MLYFGLLCFLFLQSCNSDAPPPPTSTTTDNPTTNTAPETSTTTTEPTVLPDFNVFFAEFKNALKDKEQLKQYTSFPYVIAPHFDEATQTFGAGQIAENDFDEQHFFMIGAEDAPQTGKFDEGGYLNGSLQDAFNQLYGGLSNVYYAKGDMYWAYFIADNGSYKFIGIEELEGGM